MAPAGGPTIVIDVEVSKRVVRTSAQQSELGRLDCVLPTMAAISKAYTSVDFAEGLRVADDIDLNIIGGSLLAGKSTSSTFNRSCGTWNSTWQHVHPALAAVQTV